MAWQVLKQHNRLRGSRELTLLRESTQKGKESSLIKHHVMSFNKIELLYKKMYRNLPNKGAGHSSKVKSDTTEKKTRFPAFQWWFRIENWTIIKEFMSILAICDSIGFLQTRGRPY